MNSMFPCPHPTPIHTPNHVRPSHGPVPSHQPSGVSGSARPIGIAIAWRAPRSRGRYQILCMHHDSSSRNPAAPASAHAGRGDRHLHEILVGPHGRQFGASKCQGVWCDLVTHSGLTCSSGYRCCCAVPDCQTRSLPSEPQTDTERFLLCHQFDTPSGRD